MTDHAKKQWQRRQKQLPHQRRRRLFSLLLALVLILGSGAFLFHEKKLMAITEILVWLKKSNPEDILVATPAVDPRGNIYDRNFRPLAATYETYTIYARPLEISDPAAAANRLEEILGLEEKKLSASLRSERGFVWIARGIDPDLAAAIENENIKGIYQVVETKRYYPNSEAAAHAVGFVEDGEGLDGIEFQYNSLLKGEGLNSTELKTLHFNSANEFNRSPVHLVLNLDLLIQARLESYLTRRVKINGAESGCVLLMDANSGAILGMASFPAFNPNRYWEFSSSALNNHIVTEPVYPGDLALIFQQAAAINRKNEKAQLVADSINTVESIPVLEPQILKRKKLSLAPRIDTVDPEYFSRFAQLLGFSQKPVTDIPLKDETSEASSVLLTDPSFHSSALRLLTGFTALVNNGRVITPNLLNSAYPKGGDKPLEPILASAEMSDFLHPDTSAELLDFLAGKWLKMRNRGPDSRNPMFFEAHRFAAPAGNYDPTSQYTEAHDLPEQTHHIMQSVMLGTIAGRKSRLTMVVVLSYPDNNDAAYQGAFESFGDKLSILKPNQDMIQKILYVAEQIPPVPSPDFWINSNSSLAKNFDAFIPGKDAPANQATINKKQMPDVTGKSLRAGLQTLQPYNLDIKLVGSGRIVSQQPAAGKELKINSECILKMQQKI